ncbi:MAG: shikimate kinase, partial [Defluviitaleaceae bacterium]|nr:shikimate kinase [Defluviitaleaceae bacterium]
MGIVIFGASGAGSTTLGKNVAQRLDCQYLDIDDYLWCWGTKIPYTTTRSPEDRTNDLMDDIKKHPKFVLSGTIFSNQELFNPLFDLAVFITTPAEVCAERVR